MDTNNPASRQDKILYQLKRSGPLSAKNIGQMMSITTMGIRQHLSQLESDELVQTLPEESIGRGRPVKRWALTKLGHQRFPDGHAQVTSDLLISITELLGNTALDQLIDQRTEATLTQYQSVLDEIEGLPEKLDALAVLRTREGYMAEIESIQGGFLLLEHHCPICIAAETCAGFCRSELEVFETLLKGIATVQREEHIITGARRCTYRITAL